MRSTYNVANDIFKKHVTKTTVEPSMDFYSRETSYDMVLRNRRVVTLEEAREFPNQDELDKFIDYQTITCFHDLFFGKEMGVVLDIKDIYDFRERVHNTAQKTGNIFKILDVVDEFCEKMADARLKLS